MQEGLDRDDIYIMVEDEFQAVAKTFTQHLHHAEYVRLKNLAKNQNASAISSISRPVDSITKMREETKRRKGAEARSAKQKTALQQIMGPAHRRRPQTATDESESEEEKPDDPWVGTTLQGLMTKSPRKAQTSLIGLQSVKSSTRAASGYSKPESRPLQPRKLFDLSPTAVQDYKASAQLQLQSQLPGEDEDATSSEEEDDDLDGPISKRPPTSNKPKPKTTPTRKAAREILKGALALSPSPPPLDLPQYPTIKAATNIPHPSLPSSRPSTNPSTTGPAPTSTLRKPGILKSALPTFDDPFADFARPSALQGDGKDSSRRMAKRMADLRAKKRAEEESEAKRKGGGGVSEIPVFLV